MSSTLIELTFAGPSHSAESEALVAEASRLPSVTDADIVRRAAVGPAEVKAWLEVAAVALPLLTSLIQLIRARGLKGVKLKVAGIELSADEATPADLAQVIEAAKK
jgi:hypothetical protein